MDKRLMLKIHDYLKDREEVAFAFLFGSAARGEMHSESDIDIGIYFVPEVDELEYESAREYQNEDQIWNDLERIVSRKTDMVVLNRAPIGLLYSVLQNGQKIFVRDERMLRRLWLMACSAAEDFREFVKDFVNIRARSKSLSEIDKERLLKAVVFLEQEMHDFEKFEKISQSEYQSDISTKRNMERWAENIVNVSIDMAKIILASEKRQIPETYRLILQNLGGVKNFSQHVADNLASYSKMRNLLAHEYLDIRFSQLSKFVKEAYSAYQYLVDFTKKFLEASDAR